jgi:hypothetical protein
MAASTDARAISCHGVPKGGQLTASNAACLMFSGTTILLLKAKPRFQNHLRTQVELLPEGSHGQYFGDFSSQGLCKEHEYPVSVPTDQQKQSLRNPRKYDRSSFPLQLPANPQKLKKTPENEDLQ